MDCSAVPLAEARCGAEHCPPELVVFPLQQAQQLHQELHCIALPARHCPVMVPAQPALSSSASHHRRGRARANAAPPMHMHMVLRE